jgi:glycosyltransferase involved in cell wall biosynthesis
MNKHETIGVGLFVWNGEKTIRDSILSILNQTYKKIKIYVIDNQSSDNTVKIINNLKKIKKFKNKIYLVIDKKKRSIPDVQKLIIKKFLLKYEYSLIANDDDLYASQYVEALLKKIKKEKLDMVYCLKHIINEKDKILKTKNFPLYEKKNSNFLNSIKYLIYRNHWQASFGLYKTKCYYESMKYYKFFDSSRTNYDNTNMFYFLLNYKVDCLKKYLFYYREKDRRNLDRNKIINQQLNNFKSIFLIYIFQFNFLKKILKIIKETKKVNILYKAILILLSSLIFLQKTTSFNIKAIKYLKKT